MGAQEAAWAACSSNSLLPFVTLSLPRSSRSPRWYARRRVQLLLVAGLVALLVIVLAGAPRRRRHDRPCAWCLHSIARSHFWQSMLADCLPCILLLQARALGCRRTCWTRPTRRAAPPPPRRAWQRRAQRQPKPRSAGTGAARSKWISMARACALTASTW